MIAVKPVEDHMTQPMAPILLADNLASDRECSFQALIYKIFNLIREIIQWPHFFQVTSTIIFIIVGYIFFLQYKRWRSGWVSILIEGRLREISKKQGSSFYINWQSFNFRGIGRRSVHLSFLGMQGSSLYLRRGLWKALKEYYLPSLTTTVVTLIILALVLFVPDPPQHASDLFSIRAIWGRLKTNLDKDNIETLRNIIEGLVAIIIALIVFVAESIRDRKNYDEKRVLLKISNLWVLGLLITLLPLAYLYPAGTGLITIAVVAITGFTLWMFGRVILYLINPIVIADAQQNFLRSRIRSIVRDSAKQRIGNKILSEEIGPDKEINIGMVPSKSWLPRGAKKYIFVRAPHGGMLTDINLVELKSLAMKIDQIQTSLTPVSPPTGGDEIAGPNQRRRPSAERQQEKILFLLRRFGEDGQGQENIFTEDSPVLAIRRSVAIRPGILQDIKARCGRAFLFKNYEPPSRPFRLEMKATKDRLIAAIDKNALGEIDELRQTYLLVAEEFLLTLNELGGGYTAEQARQERSELFGGWSEVGWLTEDVRDLIMAVSKSDNTDAIGKLITLPFAIAIRAFQAGDQLLFQQFMGFGSFIYSRGSEKKDSPAGKFLIERSWRYTREIIQFYIEHALADEDSDEN